MIAHFFISYLVHAKVFLPTQRKTTGDLVFIGSKWGSGFQPHEVIAEFDILLVGGVEVTSGQADVVYGIEDIGLAYAIAAYEAINFFWKGELLLFVIFEISKMDGPEKQCKLELCTKLVH